LEICHGTTLALAIGDPVEPGPDPANPSDPGRRLTWPGSAGGGQGGLDRRGEVDAGQSLGHLLQPVQGLDRSARASATAQPPTGPGPDEGIDAGTGTQR
jgi:hypothetical protein